MRGSWNHELDQWHTEIDTLGLSLCLHYGCLFFWCHYETFWRISGLSPALRGPTLPGEIISALSLSFIFYILLFLFFPLRSANPWCLWLRMFICVLVLHHCLCSYEIVSFVFCMHACLPLSFQFKVPHILTSSSKTRHMWRHWLQISANATASNLMGDYKQFVSRNQSNTFKSLFHCGSTRVIVWLVFLVTALDVLEVTNQSMIEVTDWKFLFRESPLLDRDRHEKRGGPAADGQYGSARAVVDVCWQTRDRC